MKSNLDKLRDFVRTSGHLYEPIELIDKTVESIKKDVKELDWTGVDEQLMKTLKLLHPQEVDVLSPQDSIPKPSAGADVKNFGMGVEGTIPRDAGNPHPGYDYENLCRKVVKR